MNGKDALLRKLLVAFHDSYATAVPELRDHLVAGRTVEAIRLAHTLKSVAGTLEAPAVYSAAAAVEATLRQNAETDVSALVGALAAALAPAIDAAGSLRLPAEPSIASPAERATAFSVGELDALAADLRGLLASNNLMARQTFARLQQSLVETVRNDESTLSTMQQQLDRLDFEGARSALDTLQLVTSTARRRDG